MKNTCLIVADGERARLFVAVPDDNPRRSLRLVEQATLYNAELETGTVNGPMSIDFPMTVTLQGRIGRSLTTTLGSGGPPVRVTTQNGPLTVRRPEG